MPARARPGPPTPPTRPPVNGGGAPGDHAFLRALSVLTARANLAQAGGLSTFDGKRDVSTALGYARALTIADFRLRHKRNSVAARVVEAFPMATWRGGAELIEDEDPTVTTTFEESWQDLADRLSIWQILQRADILAGLGRYAGILIGAPGEMDQELPSLKTKKAGALLYLAPYAEDELQVDAFVEDTGDPRYGLPLAYQLVPRALTGTRAKRAIQPRRVHWTRVLHVTDALLDDRVFGVPRLERVWNLLDDLEKVTGAGAEAFWLQAYQGLQFNIDKDIAIGEPEKKELQDQIDEYMHNMRRAIRTRGVEVNPLGSTTADFATNVDSILLQITTGTGIPRRILTGSESGELASTMDRTNWGERVKDRRKEMAEPHVRALVDRLIEYGALPEPDEYTVRWPRQEDLTELERVALVAQLTTANATMAGVTGEILVTGEELRDRYLGLPPLSEADATGKVVEAQPAEDEDLDEEEPEDEEAEDEAEDAEDEPPVARKKAAQARGLGRRDTLAFRQVAARYETDFRGLVQSALRKSARAIDRTLVVEALHAHSAADLEAAMTPALAALEAELAVPAARMLARTYTAGRRHGARAIGTRDTARAPSLRDLYRADQEREPKGDPDGGQFVAEHLPSGKELARISREETAKTAIPRPPAIEGMHFADRDDPADAARLKALKVPPGWKHVQLSDNPEAPVLATGRDAAGRSQSRYSAKHTAEADAEKHDRIAAFHGALPALRDAVKAAMAEDDTAAVLHLVDKTGFRVGSTKDTKAKAQAFGASTLRAGHVAIAGDDVRFRFTAKSGVPVDKTVTDRGLARLLRTRMRGKAPDDRLFQTSGQKVNTFIQRHAPGHSVKDFRTYQGTALALREIKARPAPKTAAEFKRVRSEIAKVVAAHLGNTPTMALKAYINPSVWAKWGAGRAAIRKGRR